MRIVQPACRSITPTAAFVCLCVPTPGVLLFLYRVSVPASQRRMHCQLHFYTCSPMLHDCGDVCMLLFLPHVCLPTGNLRVGSAHFPFTFFFLLSGFPPGFGVSEIGVYHENDPQKFFFSPKKRSARASRAPPWQTQVKAKRAGGCYKKNFWEGLKGQKGRREIHSLPVEVSLPLAVWPRQPWEGSPS